MKSLKNLVPAFLFILFEMAFGILLLIDANVMTKAILLCFGIVMVLLGIIYLVRHIKEKKLPERSSYLTLTFSIAYIVIGALSLVYGLVSSTFDLATVIYGAIFIILGIYKAKSYNDARKRGEPYSILTLISGVLSFAFGIVAIIKPFDSDKTLLLIAGIAMVFEAALDLVAFILTVTKPKRAAAKQIPPAPAQNYVGDGNGNPMQ
ncbi:MAG: DUF308 domain-containing protein [Clostridia bacterium]|nr:DUF308 domain-containing protein [Clostridia bacterium]